MYQTSFLPELDNGTQGSAKANIEKGVLEPVALARSTDPVTSHEAAEHMSGARLNQQQNVVLTMIRRYPDRTPGELAQVSGLDYHAIQRRVSELLEAKKIVEVEYRKCEVRGRKARVWRAK